MICKYLCGKFVNKRKFLYFLICFLHIEEEYEEVQRRKKWGETFCFCIFIIVSNGYKKPQNIICGNHSGTFIIFQLFC